MVRTVYEGITLSGVIVLISLDPIECSLTNRLSLIKFSFVKSNPCNASLVEFKNGTNHCCSEVN